MTGWRAKNLPSLTRYLPSKGLGPCNSHQSDDQAWSQWPQGLNNYRKRKKVREEGELSIITDELSSQQSLKQVLFFLIKIRRWEPKMFR